MNTDKSSAPAMNAGALLFLFSTGYLMISVPI